LKRYNTIEARKRVASIEITGVLMAPQTTMEHRLEAVEAGGARQIVGSRASQNWLDRVIGSMDDYPEFDQVVQFGREFREADGGNGVETE
jgi:hypothetical protein